MIGLSTNNNTHFAQVIPRRNSSNLTLIVEDEFNNNKTELGLLATTYEDGFLNFSFDFQAVQKRRYKLTIIDASNYIIWRGKAKGQ